MLKQRLYIGGEWREGASWTTLTSPYTGEAIAEVAAADKENVEEAIKRAEVPIK